MQVNIYIAVDSATPKVSKKKYGYVLECEIRGQTFTKEGFGQLESTYHVANLVAMAEALDRVKDGSTVNIYTEDEFVAGMMINNILHWVTNGFTTAKGKPVANQQQWIDLWRAIQGKIVAGKGGKHSYSDWIRREMQK